MADVIDDDTEQAIVALWTAQSSLAKVFRSAPRTGRQKSTQPGSDAQAVGPYAVLDCKLKHRELAGCDPSGNSAWNDYRTVTITVYGIRADVVAGTKAVLGAFNRTLGAPGNAFLPYPSGARFMRWNPDGDAQIQESKDTKGGKDVWQGVVSAEVWSVRPTFPPTDVTRVGNQLLPNSQIPGLQVSSAQMTPTGVQPGTYGKTLIVTVDAAGRITNIYDPPAYANNQFVATTPNDVGSATANTLAINAALLTGYAHIGGNPGDVVYLNGTSNTNYLVIGDTVKQTMLKVDAGIILRNAPGSNCPVLVNRAYTRPFTSLTGMSGNTITRKFTTVTSGTTSATQTVGTTTGMAAGDTLIFGGSTTAVISSITNSTTVVLTTSVTTTTSEQVDLQHPNSTPITWDSGLPIQATVDMTNGGGISLGNDDAVHMMGTIVNNGTGTTESAFFGCFKVLDATTSTAVVIRLRRIPTTPPSGSYTIRQADQHIRLEGGIFDYYHSGGNSSSSSTQTGASNTIAMLFGSAYDFTARGCKGQDAQKFLINLWGVQNAVIDDYESIDSESDKVKVYGPAFDVEVNNVYGKGGDDCLSIQTYEGLQFANFNHPGVGGDCINVRGSNINGTSGAGFALYPQHGAFLMDNCGASGLSGSGTGSTGTLVPISDQYTTSIARILPSSLSDGTGTPTIRSCYFENIECANGAQPLFLCGANSGGSALNIEHIRFSKIRSPLNSPAAVNTIVFSGLSGTLGLVEIEKCDFRTIQTAVSYLFQVAGAQVVNHLIVRNNWAQGISGHQQGYLVNLGTSGAVTKVTIENNRCDSIAGLVNQASPSTSGTTFVFGGNELNSVLAGIALVASCTVVMRDTVLGSTVGMTNGFLRASSSNNPTVTLKSGGGNDSRITSSLLWVIVNNSPTLSFAGNCGDLNIDLSATGVNRVQGAVVNNTNSALGTLGQAGPVIGDNTGASGSWHLLANPTLVY